jgi:NADH dehydrogenase (ubiquinone) Fe-S protein 6
MLPPIEVEGDVAVCDGADDTSLHPREYIKVFHEYPQECKYCGLAYIRKDKDLTD